LIALAGLAAAAWAFVQLRPGAVGALEGELDAAADDDLEAGSAGELEEADGGARPFDARAGLMATARDRATAQ